MYDVLVVIVYLLCDMQPLNVAWKIFTIERSFYMEQLNDFDGQGTAILQMRSRKADRTLMEANHPVKKYEP
jgi:hypothetical protein